MQEPHLSPRWIKWQPASTADQYVNLFCLLLCQVHCSWHCSLSLRIKSQSGAYITSDFSGKKSLVIWIREKWIFHGISNSTVYSFFSNSIIAHHIATNFSCTCHASTTVVGCAKFCSGHSIRIEMRAKLYFNWIWIASEMYFRQHSNNQLSLFVIMMETGKYLSLWWKLQEIWFLFGWLPLIISQQRTFVICSSTIHN